ncbi:MAG: hypothetical protein AB7V42_03300 [Thermoleophilia bacterium]
MYQFSRALFRDLRPLTADGADERELLSACEEAVASLAEPPRDSPSLRLFRRVLHMLRPEARIEAHALMRAHLDAARSQVGRDDEVEPPSLRRCARRGADGRRCGRRALPGSHYCERHALPALVSPEAA